MLDCPLQLAPLLHFTPQYLTAEGSYRPTEDQTALSKKPSAKPSSPADVRPNFPSL